jgi:hypothetical protein
MAGWKDKLKGWADRWSEPIEGIDGPDRGEPAFNKGDRVRTWNNQTGTVYRRIEYGDGWAYGVKTDNGELRKAVRQKDLKPLEESIVVTTLGDLRESVRRVLKKK